MTGDRTWLRYDAAAQRLTLTLHVQPGARKNEVTGLHGDALKVKIAAPAVENQANAGLVAFLSEALGVPRSAISIRRGATGRRKVVEMICAPDVALTAQALATPGKSEA